MILYHFSPRENLEEVNPIYMGSSIHAGREIENQFTNGIIREEFLSKSNWFTKDSQYLELHRFGNCWIYSCEIPDECLYQGGSVNDVDLQDRGFKGYFINGQVRLFNRVRVIRIGKIELPEGYSTKTIGNTITGSNLEEYVK